MNLDKLVFAFSLCVSVCLSLCLSVCLSPCVCMCRLHHFSIICVFVWTCLSWLPYENVHFRFTHRPLKLKGFSGLKTTGFHLVMLRPSDLLYIIFCLSRSHLTDNEWWDFLGSSWDTRNLSSLTWGLTKGTMQNKSIMFALCITFSAFVMDFAWPVL